MLQSKMTKWVACAVFGVLILGAGTVATAQQKYDGPGKFSANVALTSEYLFRGLSQTDDSPAIQGGFDYEIEVADRTNLYLGAWGSNVDFNEGGGVDGATIELDLYGGFKGKLGRTGMSWDTGLIYYAYPGADSGLNYDYWEVQGGLGYNFGIATVTVSINYTTENFGNSGEATYTKLAGIVPIPGFKDLLLTGHVSQRFIENNAAFGTADYYEWNMGATYSFTGLFDVSINYSDTDVTPDTEGKDEAILVTIGRKF